MRAGWLQLPFEEAISDETGGNVKTMQGDFQTEGRYPIVDQGKQLIGGYTDDHNRLCKARLPVIVFGDHTRSLKFIDFPFCLGADGSLALSDARSACFYARLALEVAVGWLYKRDNSLKDPYETTLAARIHEATFKALVGNALVAKATVLSVMTPVGRSGYKSGSVCFMSKAEFASISLHR